MLVHRLEHPHQCRKKIYEILHIHLDAIANEENELWLSPISITQATCLNTLS